MNRHQVLTGAANNLDHSVSIGSVENNHFTAYGSGFNLVILSSNFDRVQVISGRKFSNSILKCIECTLDTGKIAAGFGNVVLIFEPTPSAKKPSHNIRYKWVQVGSIELETDAVCVSWNNDSNKLLIGCSNGDIQMWSYNPNVLDDLDLNKTLTNTTTNTTSTTNNNKNNNTSADNLNDNTSVKFSICEQDTDNNNHHNISQSNKNNQTSQLDNKDNLNESFKFPILKKIWHKKLANSIKYLKFSPDGSLFASFGENDRLVKVWHEVKSLLQQLNLNNHTNINQESQIEFDYVYLSHPRAVTGISWRKISKFMPRGMITNALITSCKDNICRIWLETVIPDDGLLHSNEDDSNYITMAKSARHKRKLLNKLHKMKFHSHLPHIRTPFNHKEFNLHNHNNYNSLHNSTYTLLNTLSGTANNEQPQNNSSTDNNQKFLEVNNSTSKSLHSSFSCHELNIKQNHQLSQNGMVFNQVQSIHFHLAGFIDPEAGIPLHLLPNIKSSKEANFVVHWMNNKDFNFTYAAELFSREIYDKIRKVQYEKMRKNLSENESNNLADETLSDSVNDFRKRINNLKSNSSENLTNGDSTRNLSNNQSASISNDINFDIFSYLNLDEETKTNLFGNMIDHKLDVMVKDWFSSHDILFSIHPTDGSILIWLVDWLDEYLPGNFRQAQVSFHAKLPNSIPVGDAMSLTNSVFLYTEPIRIDDEENKDNNDFNESNSVLNRSDSNDDLMSKSNKNMMNNDNYLFIPGVLHMVSKHNNGTLNLWRLQFQENSKYQSLANVSHIFRTCGHRFRVSDITSHPILPFLLTNSINDLHPNEMQAQQNNEKILGKELLETFQKGLIIWGVEPVGPLSKSGGIYELARVDSSKENAFENIAWFPCFLPSTTLGNLSSSPSTLFVSTDSNSITIYQAVFDARTLLHDLQSHNQNDNSLKTIKPINEYSKNNKTDIPYDFFNVVSIQSTARPGCIIELEQLADSNKYWSKADLFHIYQEGLVNQSTSKSSNLNNDTNNKINQFNETYFLVMLEKRKNSSNQKIIQTIHMWKIQIMSAPVLFADEKNHLADSNINNNSNKFQPENFIRQQNNDSSQYSNESLLGNSFNTNTKNFSNVYDGGQKNRLTITSTRVCEQDLSLPEDVYVVCADTAAADLSSSAMFTLNKVPYLFSTACSDGMIRFWSCKKNNIDNSNNDNNETYEFFEWELNSTLEQESETVPNQNQNQNSHLKLETFPLAISCSYNSRFAVAFQKNSTQQINELQDDLKFVNFCVHIYECESTGGSEWRLEDCIDLEDVILPNLESDINFDYIFGNQEPIRPARSCHSFKNIVFSSNSNSNAINNSLPSQNNLFASTFQTNGHNNSNNSNNTTNNNSNVNNTTDSVKMMPAIPSTAAKISIKRQYSINKNVNHLNKNKSTDLSILGVSKKLIKLDWASTENGSHILTIGLGNQIFVYSCVTKEIADKMKNSIQETNNIIKSERKNSIISLLPNNISKFTLQNQSSSINKKDDLNHNNSNSDSLVKWIQFRSFELDSADDMQALPTQIKWVRDGLLIVGLNTEMQVYSQWSSLTTNKQKCLKNTQTNPAKMSIMKKENLIKNKQTNLLVPKNHSVLDLNKLNRLTSSKSSNSQQKIKKEFSTSQDEVDSIIKKKTNSVTAVFDDSQILELIHDSGIFMQAKHAWPVLPQYHPKQLFELMNSGKINRVKAILMHLTRCLIDFEMNSKTNSQKKLSRKMSICGQTEMIEEKVTRCNYMEVEAIPPLPLFALFAADNDQYISEEIDLKSNDALNKRDDLDEELDELKLSINEDNFDIDSEMDREKQLERKLEKEKQQFKQNLLNNSSNNTIYFNSKVCKLLNEYLMHVQLNGLTSIDQMYLVALADTVANVKCDVSFGQDDDLFKRKEFINKETNNDIDELSNDDEINISQTVDNCGLKFLLALRSYNYLLRTLPTANREKLKEIGLGTVNYAWAFHSECEQELINSISKFSSLNSTNGNILSETTQIGDSNQKNSITWSDLRQYGIGWWLKSSTILKQLIEKLAKCLFQQKMDPLDAALFYLAMKKKGVVLALYKTIKDVKMSEFFKNDFTDQKWQTAALKNAFVLLGKQRFEHAAAFFLLAGRLKDAIEVCIQNLKDLQLAIVIIRLYETDPDKVYQYLKIILNVEVMGYTLKPSTDITINQFGTQSDEPEKSKQSKDPFLRSMTLWYLKDYKKALHTLFDIDTSSSNASSNEIKIDLLHFSSSSDGMNNNRDAMIPHVFNFYTFLKHHPLVLKLLSIQNDENDKRKSSFYETTPIERRLHFIAGYYHLVNGCPLLTLDVLSKLPKYIDKLEKTKDKVSALDFTDNIKTTKNNNTVIEKASDFDWSAPVKKFEDEELELDFGLSDDEENEDEGDLKNKNEIDNKISTESINKQQTDEKSDENLLLVIDDKSDRLIDTFSQQIKFISCLKILIDEMSTLATGFEVQGGQLRYYMYYWLERETQVLKDLGEYKNSDGNELTKTRQFADSFSYDTASLNQQDDNNSFLNSFDNVFLGDQHQHQTSLLHEQILKDQRTFQAKINRLNKRKEWLRSNELLLRTFLSYCSLHSASGAGLCSVKMELVLLMQELVEDRSMKQLLLPVPVPTTIPLLSASLATSKNVVAGPIQMLKSFVIDILLSLSSMHTIPTIFDYSVIILTVKELAVSLSSCLYQCLCDSDAFIVSENEVVTGMQGFSRNILYKSTYLMSGMKKYSNKLNKSESSEKVHTSPKNWPGVSSLTKLLEREQDVEAPKLKILLFESLISVFASLLINSFIFYDCSTLRRLLAIQWNDEMWNRLFGGGCLTEYKYKTQPSKVSIDDENAKQRMKINAKLGHRPSVSFTTGSSPSSNSYLNTEEKIYVREHFIPPEISMINYFLNRPLDENEANKITDTNEEDDEDFEETRDVLDDDPETQYGKRYWEHMNPKSYSWCLMRYGILKYTITNIQSFLAIIGIEIQDLANLSPLVHQLLKTFENWKETILAQLNAFNGPPEDYIPGCNTNNTISLNGPKILKYQSMLDPANTPFINEKSTLEPRRLWNYLVTRKCLHEVFIRYIFKKKKISQTTGVSNNYSDFTTKRADTTFSSNMSTATFNSTNNANNNTNNTDATLNQFNSFCKIIHKDQEPIYNFCLNERDKNTLALCTSKEIIEMDIRNLMTKNAPVDDECELDILALQQTNKGNYDQDLYVIGNGVLQSSADQNNITISYDNHQKNNQIGQSNRSGSFSNVILKRSLKEVRRLAAHPTLPYYLSGTNESVVKLWHWGSTDPLASFKQSEKSSSAKITKLLFNTHGNKFGVSDMDGYLHLYQLLGCSFKSYLTLRCHKIINDFLFIDSSSILLTIGTSNDSYVLSIWDTLLPPHKSLIKSYKEIDVPSGTCAAYSPLNHFAYCGNRKGEISIYDIRTHKRLQKFTAHESSVKAIALDQDEYYIATGSSEGNVKLWNLKTLEQIHVFHNEHTKSSLIRNFNSGVNQLQFTNDNKLLSCGVDGTLVIRNL